MEKPLRFTKRPVTIEAIQYTGANRKEVEDFASVGVLVVPDVGQQYTEQDCLISWHHGNHPAVYDKLHGTWVSFEIGHWIIKGLKGEFYPCEPEVFQATYNPDSDDNPIANALHFAYQFGSTSGSHHKAWVIDQMVRALTGEDYLNWVANFEDEDRDVWDRGMAP